MKRAPKSFNLRYGVSLIAIAALVLTFTACSSDDDNSADPDPNPGGEDLYGVFWRVDNPDGRTNYVSLVEGIENGNVDPSNALEVSGKSRFFAPEDADYFVIADGEDLTFTRYNIGENGQDITEGGKFSVSNEGVTSLQKRNVFLSETKAYYIDNTQGQIIIWNPETMEITGSFGLPPEFADGYQGYSTQLGFGKYQLDGNRLIIPVGWVNFQAQTHLDKTGLAIVDVQQDEVLSYSEDDRVALAVEPAFMDNGDVYFGVSERYAFSKEARSQDHSGGILKVASGSNEFDQNYDPDFMAQIDGESIGLGLSNSPKPNHGYVKVLDTDKLDWSQDVEGSDYYGLVWETYEIDLPQNEIIGKVDRPLAPAYSENLYTFEGSGIYYAAIKVSGSEYKVIQYNTDGSYTEGLSVPGYISNMQKVR